MNSLQEVVNHYGAMLAIREREIESLYAELSQYVPFYTDKKISHITNAEIKSNRDAHEELVAFVNMVAAGHLTRQGFIDAARTLQDRLTIAKAKGGAQ